MDEKRRRFTTLEGTGPTALPCLLPPLAIPAKHSGLSPVDPWLNREVGPDQYSTEYSTSAPAFPLKTMRAPSAFNFSGSHAFSLHNIRKLLCECTNSE